MSDGRISFVFDADNSGLRRGVNEANQDLAKLGSTAEAEGGRIDASFKRMAAAAAAYLTAQQAIALGQEVINVRAERQMMEQSFEVLLQSREKAQRMITDITRLAVESPLEMTQVTSAVQTLLGFGVEAKNVMGITEQLSDVSMGNAERFKSLALVYAQVQAAGKLMGQDLLQLVNAGFNPLQVISEQTGRSMAQLKEDMSNGAISAEMVAAAFEKVTSSGGKFFEMTKKQAEGIAGVKATFQDAITQAYNKLGEANEDTIKSGYQMATSLVENFDTIGKSLAVLVAAIGTYKTAMFAVSTLQTVQTNLRYAAEAAEIAKLLPLKEAAANADVAEAVAKGRLSASAAERIVSIRAEMTAKMDALKLSAQQAAADVIDANAAHKAALTRALNAKTVITQRQMELSLAKLSGDAKQIETAQTALQVAMDERHVAVKASKITADTIQIAKSKAVSAGLAVQTAQTAVTATATVAASAAQNLFTAATARLTIAMHGLKTAFLSNPITMIATVLATAATAIYMFSSKTEEALKGVSKASADASKSFDDEAAKVDALRAQVEDGNLSYDERKKKLDALNDLVPGYEASLSREGELIIKNKGALDEYLVSLEKTIRQKAIQSEFETAFADKRRKERAAEKKIEEGTADIKVSERGFITSSGKREYTDAEKAKIRKNATREEEEAIAKLREELAKTSTETVKSGETIKSYSEQVSESEKKVNALSQKLKDLRSGKVESKDLAGDIENTEKEKRAAEERYAALTGVSAGADKKARTEQQKKQEEFYKDQMSQWDTAKKEEIAALRSTITDKAELRKFDYEQTMARIEREKLAYIELAKVAGEKAPDTTMFEERKQSATIVFKNTEDQEKEDKIRKQAEENEKLLTEYATFTEKYLAKTKELAEKKAAILAAGGTQENVAVLTTAIEGQQATLDEQFYKNTEGFKAFSEEIIALSLEQLATLLESVQADLAASTEGVATESQASMRVQIEMLQKQLAAKKSKEPTSRDKELKQWQNMQKTLNGVVQVSNQVIDSFDGISDSTKKVLKTVINVSASAISMVDSIKMFGQGSVKAVEGAAKATGESIKTVEKGSVILAVISAALQIATAIVDLFVGASKKRKEEMEKMQKEIYEQESAYNEVLRERALLYAKGITVFGVDEYGKAINSAKVGLEALADLQEKLTTGGKARLTFSLKDGIKDARTEIEKAYGGLGNIEIKTGTKKSGFLGLGRKDVYTGILQVYPDLIDANGKFNASLAQTIVDSRTMSDESKRSLQGMIDLANHAEDAFSQVDDFLTGIFGELGNNMTNGIVESFKAGKVAATTFVDDISALLEQLANQMLYSVMLQPLFEAASKQMKEITTDITLSPEEQFKRMSSVLGSLAKDATGKQAQMAALLEKFKKDAAAEGLDIYKKEAAKQGQAEGSQAMSLTEETGASLEGKLTAVQLTSAQTSDNTKLMSDSMIRIEPLVLDIRDTMDILSLNARKTFDEVVLIRQFAASLPEIDRKMAQVVTNTAGLV